MREEFEKWLENNTYLLEDKVFKEEAMYQVWLSQQEFINDLYEMVVKRDEILDQFPVDWPL